MNRAAQFAAAVVLIAGVTAASFVFVVTRACAARRRGAW